MVTYSGNLLSLDDTNAAESGLSSDAFQIGNIKLLIGYTLEVEIVSGASCVVLILFAAWSLYRATWAREATLRDIKKSAVQYRTSRWAVVRKFQGLSDTFLETNAPYWAHVKLIMETGVTALQILTIVGYAEKGYAPSALVLYMIVCATDVCSLLLLGRKRSMGRVQGFLVVNAMASAFYGFFPLFYISYEMATKQRVRQEGGAGSNEFKPLLELDSLWKLEGRGYHEGLLGSGDAVDLFLGSPGGGGLFEGGRDSAAWKIVTRILPLFGSVHAIDQLVGLDYFLGEEEESTEEEETTTPALVAGSDVDSLKCDVKDYSSTTATVLPLRSTRASRSNDAVPQHAPEPRAGIAKMVVGVPVVIFLGTLLVLLARLVTLVAPGESGGCMHPAAVGDGQLSPRWPPEWCLRRAYPLSSMSPDAACACVVIYPRGLNTTLNTLSRGGLLEGVMNLENVVGGGFAESLGQKELTRLRSANQFLGDRLKSTCSSSDLKNLRDALVGTDAQRDRNEPSMVASYVQALFLIDNGCATENTTQVAEILVTPMPVLSTLVVKPPNNVLRTALDLRLRGPLAMPRAIYVEVNGFFLSSGLGGESYTEETTSGNKHVLDSFSSPHSMSTSIEQTNAGSAAYKAKLAAGGSVDEAIQASATARKAFAEDLEASSAFARTASWASRTITNRTIPSRWLAGAPNMMHVSLEFANLRSLDADTFSGNKGLFQIRLGGNELTSIAGAVFAQNKIVQWIFIQNQRIRQT